MDGSNDVQMQEEPSQEVNIAAIQTSATNGLTDSLPEQPLQTQSAPAQPIIPDSTSASLQPTAVITSQAARPSSIPPPPAPRPEKAAVHGGPTRQYLNQNITPHLLEGMKYLAMYEPEKPLSWLADFLKDRSKQVEG